MLHTPGPWAITPLRMHDGSIDIIGPYSAIIARIPFSPRDSENARLIAAAPELLAAAKDALCVIQDRNPIKAQLKAAIAKAETE